MLLDIRTLLIVVAATQVLMVVCLAAFAGAFPTFPGFRAWVASALMSGVGLFLLAMRGQWPDALTMVLANACLVAGLALSGHGLKIFAGKPSQPWWDVGLLIVWLVGSTWFGLYAPSYRARVAVFSSVMVPLLPRAGWPLLRAPGLAAGFGRTAGALFLVGAVVHAVRLALVPSLPPEVDLLTPHWANTLPLLMMTGINGPWVFASIFMSAKRLDDERLAMLKALGEQNAELARAVARVKDLEGILPICMHCKRIRDDRQEWQQVETYLTDHAAAQFSHGICADCYREQYGDDSQP